MRRPARSVLAALAARVPAPLRRAAGRVGGLGAVVTSSGWFVLGTGVVCLVVSRQLGWVEASWMAASAFALLVVAVAFVFGRAVLAVTVSLEPQRVVVGDRSVGHLGVTNVGSRRLLPLRVELAVGRGVAEFDVASLSPGETHEEVFVLPTQRRSVVDVGPASSVRGDPLGLLRKVVRWTDPVTLYVHPATVTFDRMGAGFLRDLEGQPTNDLSNSDVAFHALREYEPGDDRRHIHWRSYARVGQLMVRQFVDSRRSHLAIVQSGVPEDYASAAEFELAVSLAASLALRTLRDEQQVTMAVAGAQVPAFAATPMLDALAAVEPGGHDAGLLYQAIQMNRLATGVSLVALVTGSRQPLADVRAAANRFPSDVRTLVLRADVDGASGFRPVGATTVLTVHRLTELPRVMWAAAR